jgi:methyltransferase (TIGR00027 family)
MAKADLPEGVGKTALGVAMVRAGESAREDRLFDAPYAQTFFDAAPGAFDAEEVAADNADDVASRGAVFWSHAVIRTRFFDDYLLDTVANGVRQVVLLAAGLDTRALRLTWPDGAHVYELDLPEVLAFKERVLAGQANYARRERTVVTADLSDDWAHPLLSAGFRTAEATAWLAEGLLIYLSEQEAASLLGRVGELSGPANRMTFEFESLGTEPMRARSPIGKSDKVARRPVGSVGSGSSFCHWCPELMGTRSPYGVLIVQCRLGARLMRRSSVTSTTLSSSARAT